MTIKQIEMFETDDGQIFKTIASAKLHEDECRHKELFFKLLEPITDFEGISRLDIWEMRYTLIQFFKDIGYIE